MHTESLTASFPITEKTELLDGVVYETDAGADRGTNVRAAFREALRVLRRGGGGGVGGGGVGAGGVGGANTLQAIVVMSAALIKVSNVTIEGSHDNAHGGAGQVAGDVPSHPELTSCLPNPDVNSRRVQENFQTLDGSPIEQNYINSAALVSRTNRK